MIFNIIDNDTKEFYGSFKTNKNASSKTIHLYMIRELQKIFDYKENIKTMTSGKIDYATGEKDLFYVCFGIKKNIKLIPLENN